MSSGFPDWTTPSIPVIVNMPEGTVPSAENSNAPISPIYGFYPGQQFWLPLQSDSEGILQVGGGILSRLQIWGWDVDQDKAVKILVNEDGKLVTTDGGGGVKLQDNHLFVDAVVFDTAAEAYTSESFDVSDYAQFLLLINLAVTLAPTDIVIKVQFSYDNTNWYNYMIDFWGDLRYEDSAGAKMECLPGLVLAPYMRIYVLSSGCSATNKFTLSINAVLNS